MYKRGGSFFVQTCTKGLPPLRNKNFMFFDNLLLTKLYLYATLLSKGYLREVSRYVYKTYSAKDASAAYGQQYKIEDVAAAGTYDDSSDAA